jgi:hypothetical protein
MLSFDSEEAGMATEAVTEAEVRALIKRWGELQDRQAGLAAFLPMVARDGFYLEFDGQRWEGYEGLESHQQMTRRFFDEQHEIFDVRLVPRSDATHALTSGRWDARYRPEGSPVSRQIKTRVEHDWEFRRDPATGQAVMQGHKVLKLEYLPGFAPDDAPAGDVPHLGQSKS